MKIAIVGWGVEGQSAYKYFGPEHNYLIVNEEPRDDFPHQSDKVKVQFNDSQRQSGLTGNVSDLSYLDGIRNYDKIVYTGSSAKNLEKLFPEDRSFWQKAVTVYSLFFGAVKTKNIIGVTGTKGKGTTSTLVAKMLEASGKKVFLGGNVGLSPLDFVNDVAADDWVVLELANFQLYKFPYSPRIAVCLMLAEEHLEWHPNMDDYMEAKSNIFRHQSKEDIAIYFADDERSTKIAGYSPGKKIPYYKTPGAYVRDNGTIVVGESETEILDKSEVKLLGEHNLQNVCAALTAVWQVDQDAKAARDVLTSFSGLEHRLEFVRELGGVKYFDDSFGTTPDTLAVALKAFSQPVVLIAGGHDKGADYEAMAEDIIKARVKHVIAIGEIADRVSGALRQNGYSNITFGLSTMPEIVAAAHKIAEPGDVVLLSAGTSSFGLFKDYKDRGSQFKQAVLKLSEAA